MFSMAGRETSRAIYLGQSEVTDIGWARINGTGPGMKGAMLNNTKAMAMRIRSARRTATLTQSELASALSLSRGAVAQWESPTGSRPSAGNLVSLAITLKCSFEWLATGRGSLATGQKRVDDEIAAAVTLRYFAQDDAEEQILSVYRHLKLSDQQLLLAIVEAMSARPGKRREQS